MGNLHRIQWFDQQIKAGHYPNSSLLAAQFEISRRQAQRDIEYMAASLRAPLEYVAARRGYRYENEAYALPNLYLTEEEIAVLKYLSHRYRNYNYDGSGAANRVSRLLADMLPGEGDGGRPPGRLPVFDADPLLAERLDRLSYAAGHRRIVELAEAGEGGSLRRRLVLPLKIVNRFNADYVLVRYVHDCSERLVRLDKIASVTVTKEHPEPAGETNRTFERDDGGRLARRPFTALMTIAGVGPEASWNGYPLRKSDAARDLYEVLFFDAEAFMQQLLTNEWEALLSPKWLISRLEARLQRLSGRLRRQVTAAKTSSKPWEG